MPYVVYLKEANIAYGLGQSEDEAWSDAMKWVGDGIDYSSVGELKAAENFGITACSPALAKAVESGSVDGWEFGPGRIAITKEEADA